MFLNRQGFNQSAIRPAAKAYLQTLLFLEEAGASESHGGEPMDAPESHGLEKNPEIKVHSTTHALASQTISRPHAEAIADALMGPTLNKINMNIQGDRVHINALLDSKGLAELETKIAALKILLAVHYAANDTGVQESESLLTTIYDQTTNPTRQVQGRCQSLKPMTIPNASKSD
ncbi:MAG: hypothetical protein IPF48_10325 [Sphingomonadales bacterium]|nr:hypothetical protein [Sphingomonadales bacterium]